MKLFIAFVLVAEAVPIAAHLGWVGAVVFALLACAFAAALRAAKQPWPYVIGFWLLPCVPSLLLVWRAFVREGRAREATEVRRCYARAGSRPIAVWYAIIGWLAARPPDASPRVALAFLAAALVLIVAFAAFDLVALQRLRSRAREAAGAFAVERPEEGTPVFDFGVGDGFTETRVDAGADAYRSNAAPTTRVYRGDASGAVSVLAKSLVWDGLALVLATALALARGHSP